MELLDLLIDLEADDKLPDDSWKYLGQGERPSAREVKVMEKIATVACSFLITEEGKPNFAAMKLLERNGFHVGPGETDSFGWLSGIIYTRKGKIVYG